MEETRDIQASQAPPAAENEIYQPAQSCIIRFPAALEISPGQSHPHVLLAKAMLRALSDQFPEMESGTVSPLLDGASSQSLKCIQSCSGLPVTGNLDKCTWNRLCRLYRAVFDRFHAPSCG